MTIHYPAGVIPPKTLKAIRKIKRKVASAANRGMGFEKDINDSNAYYLSQDLALVYKRPTPINVVRVDYTHGAKITQAYFETQSTTDYNGVYKGRYLDFEAKSTRSRTSFPLNNIEPQQVTHLRSVIRNGGVAFFLINCYALGETYLLPALSDPLEELPPFSREELERALRKNATPDDHVPAMLAHLSRILRGQHACSRLVSLTSVALAIKSIYCAPGSAEPGHAAAEDPFTVPEILSLVQTTCREVLGRMASEYVDSGKVERDMFRNYVEVIEKNVAQRFTGEDSDGHSLYAGLQSLVPSLSEAEYRSTHRARLEYLARLAYKRSVEVLRLNI